MVHSFLSACLSENNVVTPLLSKVVLNISLTALLGHFCWWQLNYLLPCGGVWSDNTKVFTASESGKIPSWRLAAKKDLLSGQGGVLLYFQWESNEKRWFWNSHHNIPIFRGLPASGRILIELNKHIATESHHFPWKTLENKVERWKALTDNEQDKVHSCCTCTQPGIPPSILVFIWQLITTSRCLPHPLLNPAGAGRHASTAAGVCHWPTPQEGQCRSVESHQPLSDRRW